MAGKTSSDPNVFILPDLGEGVHEAELIAWKVKPGDTVEEHDVVAEMETDKALVEVPSPRAGVIKELFGSVGDILKVGEPAWTYEADGAAGGGGAAGAPADNGAAHQQEPKPEPAPDPQPVRQADAAQAAGSSGSGGDEDAGTVVGTMSGGLGGVSRQEGKALAAPAVRRLARDMGIDIDRVPGTGIGGRVTDKDVRAFAAQHGSASSHEAAPAPQPQTAPQPAATPGTANEGMHPAASDPGSRPQPQPQAQPQAQPAGGLATTVARQPEVADRPPVLIPDVAGDSNIIPMRGVRRTIANRLRQSVDRAVHFSVMDDADVSKLDEVRKQLGRASGEKLSYLPFVVSATIRALQKFPALNAYVDDENEQIVRHARVHMGIAADTEQGLTVPVIPFADDMGVLELGRQITDLARMTRDRSIPQDRLKGSTFTISNVGSYAGKYATPIINYPEVGILAAGRVYEGVVADKGAIRVAKLLPMSLTCDHRSVDGAEAARCLAHIVELLGHPESLLEPARG